MKANQLKPAASRKEVKELNSRDVYELDNIVKSPSNQKLMLNEVSFADQNSFEDDLNCKSGRSFVPDEISSILKHSLSKSSSLESRKNSPELKINKP